MGTVLVTVSAPGARLDVALADDVPVAELVIALVRRCAPDPPAWSRWALAAPGGVPFPPRLTLAALGVVDGAELQLLDMVAGDARDARDGVAGRTGIGPSRGAEGTPGTAPEPGARRRLISDLAERMVDDIARIRAGSNPLLEYASAEARRGLRALAPEAFDRSPQGGASDLSLSVAWPRDPQAPVEAIASFTTSTGDPLLGRAGHTATPDHRLRVQMRVDASCRLLLEAGVAAGPPVS